MQVVIKTFEELNTNELFDILKLRSDIFIVEQDCAYPDIDDYDKKSIHLYLEDNNQIIAYLRIINKNIKNEYVNIGRVVTLEHLKGHGAIIMNKAIEYIENTLNEKVIYIEAQSYARKFYEKFNFKQISKEFVEDGIPHIKMLRK